MSHKTIPSLLVLAAAVKEAASFIASDFRQPSSFTIKEDGTYVTDTDKAVDHYLCNWVRDCFPHMGYISEESKGILPDDCTHALYVDPLDGTHAFMRGLASVTTVATIMEKDGAYWYPVTTVIVDQIHEDIWGETLGDQTAGNGKYCTVTKAERPRITISTWPDVPFNLLEVLRTIEDQNLYDHQQFGGIALGAGLIASGFMQATVFGGKSAVETVAMSLIVRGAGGIATDLDGNQLAGYQLIEIGDRLDFHLPRGAIMASDQALVTELVQLIKYKNK